MIATVPVTIVIPARDEASRIAMVVAAHRWADEIIVVDNGSADDTVAVAEAAGARVMVAAGCTIGAARNRGAFAARHDWILALDADEVADARLVSSIAAAVGQLPVGAWRMRRLNIYLGREQHFGALRSDWVVRLYRRSLRFDEPNVHESLVVDGTVGTLAGTLRHEPYRDLAHHVEKIDRYARWGAADLAARGRAPMPGDRTIRPLWRFIRSYLLRGGFLGGSTGLIASRMEARSVYLKYLHLAEGAHRGP